MTLTSATRRRLLGTALLLGALALRAPAFPQVDRETRSWPAVLDWDGVRDLSPLLEGEYGIDHVREGTFEIYVTQSEYDRLRGQDWELEWVPTDKLSWWKEDRPKTLAGLATPLTFYPTYEEIVADLVLLEDTYPALCRLESIGQSVLGRELYFLKITDNPEVEEAEPEFKYIATMHGDEPLGTILCINLIHRLLEDYGTDARIAELVNSTEIRIMPVMNPDGYSGNPRYRFNANNRDLNRVFPDPIEDPNNTTTGRQPEVAAMMNYEFSHSSTFSANLHGGEIVMNYPFDHTFDLCPDNDLFYYLSRIYADRNSAMFANNSFPFDHGVVRGAVWYVIDGGMQDWNYWWMGCNEITIELNKTKTPAASQLVPQWNLNEEAMLSYMEQVHLGVGGRVRDAGTNKPLEASVEAVGRDHKVYTDPQVGDYHRMLLPGTYDLLFTAEGYEPLLVEGVEVEADSPTTLNVLLTPDQTLPTPTPRASFILLR
jgi:carboxypeptidase D